MPAIGHWGHCLAGRDTEVVDLADQPSWRPACLTQLCAVQVGR